MGKLCHGKNREGNACSCTAVIGTNFCGRHKYMIPYTPEMMKQLKVCKGCKKYMYLGDNVRCEECTVKYDAIIRCKGTDRNHKACEHMPVNDTNFCNFHQYMISYTEQMMNALTLCSGCKMMKYLGDCKQCSACHDRGKENREEDKKHHIKCKYDGCPDKKSDENDYCGKHKRQQWIDDVIAMGKKPCNGNKRKCRNILDKDYQFEFCLTCRCKPEIRLKDIKRGALERNLEMTLSDDEILSMLCKTCGYCNKNPEIAYQNGIDRIDNNKGYTHNNVIACCDVCNTMKGTHNIDMFLTFCKNINNNYPSKKIINDIVVINKYSDIKYKAGKRNIEFNISAAEFKSIMRFKCNYCSNSNHNSNGLDRIDSTKNYVVNNVVPCCGVCNIMKNNYSISTFIDTIKRIIQNDNLNKIKTNNIKLNLS